jgi:hypothetical protein
MRDTARTPRRAIILALFAALLAGIVLGAGGTIAVRAASHTPPSPWSAPPPAFQKPAQVIDYLNRAGLPCGAEDDGGRRPDRALAVAGCGPILIMLFPDEAGARTELQAIEMTARAQGWHVYFVILGGGLLNLGFDEAYARDVAALFRVPLIEFGGPAPAPSR